jgi:hypothetical protein
VSFETLRHLALTQSGGELARRDSKCASHAGGFFVLLLYGAPIAQKIGCILNRLNGTAGKEL